MLFAATAVLHRNLKPSPMTDPLRHGWLDAQLLAIDERDTTPPCARSTASARRSPQASAT
jgi:hypothetical protein